MSQIQDSGPKFHSTPELSFTKPGNESVLSDSSFKSIQPTPSVLQNNVPDIQSAPTVLQDNVSQIQDNGPKFHSAPELLVIKPENASVSSNDSFRSIPSNMPEIQSAPPALQDYVPQIQDSGPKFSSAPEILVNEKKDSFESIPNKHVISESLPTFSPEKPVVAEKRMVSAIAGGSGNPYGPKKITIYKILGLLLLSFYLEHYKK